MILRSYDPPGDCHIPGGFSLSVGVNSMYADDIRSSSALTSIADRSRARAVYARAKSAHVHSPDFPKFYGSFQCLHWPPSTPPNGDIAPPRYARGPLASSARSRRRRPWVGIDGPLPPGSVSRTARSVCGEACGRRCVRGGSAGTGCHAPWSPTAQPAAMLTLTQEDARVPPQVMPLAKEGETATATKKKPKTAPAKKAPKISIPIGTQEVDTRYASSTATTSTPRSEPWVRGVT